MTARNREFHDRDVIAYLKQGYDYIEFSKDIEIRAVGVLS